MSDTAAAGRAWVAGLSCLLLAACAGIGSGRPPARDCRSDQDLRARLNVGYSQFYATARELAGSDELLWVKVESPAVEQALDAVARYDARLAARLETLTQQFPALAIDRPPMPAIELAAERRERRHVLARFAPFVGRTGSAFERELLLLVGFRIHHQMFVAEALAAQEPVAALSDIAHAAGERYLALYNRLSRLLDARYFKEDLYQPETLG